jgi:2-octaprenylphenol hydroxylase
MAEPTLQSVLPVDVVIVGGGIAGLATAAALSGLGRTLAVLEARELPVLSALAGGDLADASSDASLDAPAAYDSRVSALTLRSIAFLTRLGAWSAIDAVRHCAYSHMTVWDAEGTGRIEFDADEVGAGSLGSIVENRLISAALAARVAQLRDVSVHAPARLAGIQRDGDGATTVQLESGEQLRCSLLIAADGALSPTRELLGLGTREWDYGHRAIVTTAAFERGHQSTAWQRFLQTGPLALLPLCSRDDRLCSIVWSIDDDKADRLLNMDTPAFAAALGEASEHCLGAVTDCAARHAFPCASAMRSSTCCRVRRWSAMRRIRFIPWPVRGSTSASRMWRCWRRSLRVLLTAVWTRVVWMYCGATSAGARATTWR